MFLPLIFTFRAGPVLQLYLLSHFSHVYSGKNKEQRLICFLFRIYMQKLLCRTTCLMIHLFFCRTICGSSKKSSELAITAPVDDQYSESDRLRNSNTCSNNVHSPH